MLGVVTPNDAKVFICFMIPFGGEIMNAFGHVIYPKNHIDYFEKFCRQILRNF